MKTNILLALLFAGFALGSCNDETKPEANQGDWSKTIMYNVDKNTAYFDDLNDEDFSEFTAMGEQIIQDVLDGKLKAYDAFEPDVELSMVQINAELFSIDTLFIENPETYEHEPVAIENDFTKGVVAFKFKEQWNYDAATGMIDKKVIAVAPKKAVLSPTSGEVRGFRSLFWVKLQP
ncbi:MAG: hypothetical protein ACI85F_000375 [Bacteroidia bacterium]|jgi:hypothetical protein